MPKIVVYVRGGSAQVKSSQSGVQVVQLGQGQPLPTKK